MRMLTAKMLFSSGQTIATSEIVTKCCIFVAYATSYNYNIIEHSPTCYLRDGQTDATLTLNNIGLCCDRMLRPFDQGLIIAGEWL